VEPELEGRLELVDDAREEGRQVVREGVLGSRRVRVEPLLQVLHDLLLELAGERLHFLGLLLVQAGQVERPHPWKQERNEVVVALYPGLVLVLLLQQRCDKLTQEGELIDKTLVGFVAGEGGRREYLAEVVKLLVHGQSSHLQHAQ
jgi:hypothetical protein